MAFSALFLALSALPTARAQDEDEKPPDFSSKSVAQWIAALKKWDDKKGDNRWASEALGPKGPYAKEAVPALIESFKDDDWHREFNQPAVTLAIHGKTIVPRLIQALKRPEAAIRAGAAETLQFIRPKPKEAIPALIAAAKDQDANVRYQVIETLTEIGRSDPEAVRIVIAAVEDQDHYVRIRAIEILSSMPRKAEAAIGGLIKALRDKHSDVRDEAASTLREIGAAAKDAVPELIKLFQDKKYSENRGRYALALGGIGPAAKEAVPVLIASLREPGDHRYSAALALGEFGPEAKDAVSALVQFAKDSDEQHAYAAIHALGQIGAGAKEAIPYLIQELSSTNNSREVADTLGSIGPEAKDAVPRLIRIVQDRSANRDLRETAARSMEKIDPVTATRLRVREVCQDLEVGKIAELKLEPQSPLTDAEKKEIKALIAKLAEVDSPDYGMAPTLSGHAFAPLPDRGHFGAGLITDHQLKTTNAFRRLVEIGPKALPFLLEGLSNQSPTKLRVDGVGMTVFGNELPVNPLNPSEQVRPITRKKMDEDDDVESAIAPLCVGDICFVAIGQIVGRSYQAVRYQPTATVIVNSPARQKELRDRIRVLWASSEPVKKLLDTLLFDYAIRGVFDGKDLHGWYEASQFQCEAAMRLLYYFPKESGPMIAERLKRFNTHKPKKENDDWKKREGANGVFTKDFLEAINWCQEPSVRDAMLDNFRRTEDPTLMLATLPSVTESHRELVIPRFRALLTSLPAAEEWWREDGYELLLALGQFDGKAVKPEIERYLKNPSLQRRWTVCRVLEELKSDWSLEFLTPMLTDKRVGDWGNKSTRLCDTAAEAIAEIYPDLKFDSKGTYEELDKRIEQLREQIAKKKQK
jgi:HEAT repeat protein